VESAAKQEQTAPVSAPVAQKPKGPEPAPAPAKASRPQQQVAPAPSPAPSVPEVKTSPIPKKTTSIAAPPLFVIIAAFGVIIFVIAIGFYIFKKRRNRGKE